VNSLRFLSSLPDASGKSLLRKHGFEYMLSPMVEYTSCIIMQAIPARVILVLAEALSADPLAEADIPKVMCSYSILSEQLICVADRL